MIFVNYSPEIKNNESNHYLQVSIMLRENRQLNDGLFVLFPGGSSEPIDLPYNAVVPGTIRYVNQSNGTWDRKEEFMVPDCYKTDLNQASRSSLKLFRAVRVIDSRHFFDFTKIKNAKKRRMRKSNFGHP